MLLNLRARSRLGLSTIREWIINHDESWLFIVLYIGLAVILSIWISLFWLVAVVAVHFAFEWIRQNSLRTEANPVFLEVVWELKLDIALVLFALVLSLYMDVVLGVVGLQSAARAGAAAQAGLRGSARFAAWQRLLRGVLLSVDDAAQVARAVGTRRSGTDEPDENSANPEGMMTLSKWGSWSGRWGKGDWISVAMAVVCTLLIVLAPWLTEHTFGSGFMTLATELHPFPWLLE